jgi:multidrug resistance efflux pump
LTFGQRYVDMVCGCNFAARGELHMVRKEEGRGAESPRGEIEMAESEIQRAEAEIKAAEGELHHAEADLKHAEEDLDRAKEDEHRHPHEALVEFEDVNSLESVDFHTPWQTKLNAAWTEAARLLEEPRRTTDRLQTPEGKDLTPDLDLTLRDLEERKIVTALKFQIVGPTGGA